VRHNVSPGARTVALPRSARVAPEDRRSLTGRPATGREYQYNRLMTVEIRHTFYNAPGQAASDPSGVCPDFDIMPTAATNAMMRSLGLMFREEIGGFSVAWDDLQTEQLASFVRRQVWPVGCPAGGGRCPARCCKDGNCLEASRCREPSKSRRSSKCDASGLWTRLSFMLVVRNPEFFNFTRAVELSEPDLTAWYYTNCSVTPSKNSGAPRNDSNDPRDGSGDPQVKVVPLEMNAVARYDLTRAQYQMHRVGEATAAYVKDLACDVVQCVPIGGADTIYLDFGGLPGGLYQTEQCDGDETVEASSWMINAETSPSPFALIDLLFTAPCPARGLSSPGDFPISNLCPSGPSETPVVQCKSYSIRFEARKTTWNYFVVQRGRDRFDRLWINNNSTCEPASGVSFDDNGTVPLPNGAMARRFTSDVPIAFQAHSDCSFELIGRPLESQRKDRVTIVDRLPVAAPDQLSFEPPQWCEMSEQHELPERGDGPSISEMYVYI